MGLVSVIVPVYTDKFLRECLDSIIQQTYKNLEIILVDDESKDNSYQICLEYAEQDSRIKVFRKKNGGQSSARNAGLDMAAGDFIMFVDDDWLELNAVEIAVEKIQSNDADIAWFGTNVVKNRDVYKHKFAKSELLRDVICNTTEWTNLFTPVWDKLYRKKLWENLRFPLISC